KSYNCFIPMPFRKSARVVLTNETGKQMVVFYDIAATLGNQHDENMLYFHSHWRRENPTTIRKDMTILPRVEGRGRFLGCHHGIHLTPSMSNFWWGEGEVKVYLDGDKEWPTLCGTGTEDYVGSAYGQGLFDNMYQGNHFVDKDKHGLYEKGFQKAYGFYRFHIPDPIYFHKDIKVTIQVMGGPAYFQMLESLKKDPSLKFMKAGDGTQYYTREELEANPRAAKAMERYDDHCSTAYWYMDKPENGLPPLASLEERLADLP
ncbi:MAG: glycoside hydrolase family 172 protein, partial [Planctomycetota bacterium]